MESRMVAIIRSKERKKIAENVIFGHVSLLVSEFLPKSLKQDFSRISKEMVMKKGMLLIPINASPVKGTMKIGTISGKLTHRCKSDNALIFVNLPQ